MRKNSNLYNTVAIGDLHCGDQLGLFPCDAPFKLDGGGIYEPNIIQKKIWAMWQEFWTEHVPRFTKGENYDIVICGDLIDGRHHGAVHQISQNLATQAKIAQAALDPVIKRCRGRLYIIRGTEAHTGPSGEQEELLAERLGALPNEEGNYARFDLWKKIGDALVHFLHHIGTTSSQAYETTAPHKELIESLAESARWRQSPPDIIVRAHRHRLIKTEIASGNNRAQAVVLPGWQGKTPFTWKVAGGRITQPQIGGVVLRQGDAEFFTLHKIWALSRSKEVE